MKLLDNFEHGPQCMKYSCQDSTFGNKQKRHVFYILNLGYFICVVFLLWLESSPKRFLATVVCVVGSNNLSFDGTERDVQCSSVEDALHLYCTEGYWLHVMSLIYQCMTATVTMHR